MASRAAELGIPADISVGEKSFQSFGQAHTVEIDTLLKRVCVLR